MSKLKAGSENKQIELSRATILDLEIEIPKLRQEIAELKIQHISSRDQRLRLRQAEADLAKWKPQIEAIEARQKLSPKEEAIRKRQEVEAEKARQLRLSREAFQPRLETLSQKERDRRDYEKSRGKISMWTCRQKRPKTN